MMIGESQRPAWLGVDLHDQYDPDRVAEATP